jgi:hypothetical protein
VPVETLAAQIHSDDDHFFSSSGRLHPRASLPAGEAAFMAFDEGLALGVAVAAAACMAIAPLDERLASKPPSSTTRQ